MLLEFKIKNYKSFLDEVTFSMLAAPKQKGLDYSVFQIPYKGKAIKVLPTSVVYGPNAAGKTNIIGALDTLKEIVLRGNIRNSDDQNMGNPAASNLELIPNSSWTTPQPVEFYIDFIEADKRIQYKIVLDLGIFTDEKYERKILRETLIVDDILVFERIGNSLEIKSGDEIAEVLSNQNIISHEAVSSLVENSLDSQELFLTNGFRLVIAPKLAKFIIDWFSTKLEVICRADSVQVIKRFAEPQKKTIYVDRIVNDAAKIFGINSNALGYIPGENDADPKLVSVWDNLQDRKVAIDAEMFESYGTIRFMNTFPLVAQAIANGTTLVIDEFDASLHPMALMSIINVFHNDDINIFHAQLIINTHNPIFLNSNLLRRDEIKFVERDDETHASSLYALSDFGTSGARGVRQHEDYMKNYFISRYGAIKDIDFTPIFEKIIAKNEGVE